MANSVAKIVLPLLSIGLGAYIVYIGAVKFTPAVNKAAHEDITKVFIRAATVYPFTVITGIATNPTFLRLLYGTIEIVCGSILVFAPGGFIKAVADYLLFIFLILGGLYTIIALGDPLKTTLPIIFAGTLMIVRHVLMNQALQHSSKKATVKKAR